MKSETRSIEGAADFELGVPRSRPLSYTVSTPDEGKPKGLVFVIPGFGGDTGAGYGEALRRHICDIHGFAAVSVAYHCIEARPENGAGLNIPPREHFMLAGVAAQHGVKVANYGDINALTVALKVLNTPIDTYAEILPGGGEYQNFGIVQAMDHLAVLADLVAKGPAFDKTQVIALGSSHGGYIAQLMAKIAPGSLSLVIDNSSYTQPPMNYMGMSREGELRIPFAGVMLVGRVKNGWTLDDRELANFYSRDADLIRDAGHPPHLAVQHSAAMGEGPRLYMVNAAEDAISPPAMKRRQAAAMRAAGFDVRLEIIDRPQLDGRVFKALVHGLDASLKGLFDRALPLARPGSGTLDCEAATIVDYPCVDRAYRFTHTAAGVVGETYELYPMGVDEDGQAAA
jgi:pimeloyl-ACP methyl ester carboxylesterase